MSSSPSDMWCFYQISTGRMVEGLSTDESRAFVMGLNESDKQYYLVWCSSWSDWRKLTSLTELPPVHRELDDPPPALPGPAEIEALASEPPEGKKVTVAGQGPQGLVIEFTGENIQSGSSGSGSIIQLDSVDITGSDMFVIRKDRRFVKRFEILIMKDSKTFTTHSRDISVGGVLLEDCLPEWVHGQFKVRIKKPNSKQLIELTACLIGKPDDEEKVRIGILPLQSKSDEKNLENWLAA